MWLVYVDEQKKGARVVTEEKRLQKEMSPLSTGWV
jgi:hypothetical protein